MNLKTLTLAVAMTAAIVPAQAQVSGGFAFQMPIYDASGRAVFNGIPRGGDTHVYDFKGRFIGRVIAKAFIDGRTISLLDLHIGCTDVDSARVARLAPNSADRTKCDLVTPSKPYTVVQTYGSLPGTNSRDPSGVCLRPLGTEETCRWVFLYAQRLYTENARTLEVGSTFLITEQAAPNYRENNLWTCKTLEELRSGDHSKCGAPASGQRFEVAQKDGDAVCYRNAGQEHKNDPCGWAVLAPKVYTIY